MCGRLMAGNCIFVMADLLGSNGKGVFSGCFKVWKSSSDVSV